MSTVLARFIQISDLHFDVPCNGERRFIAGGRDVASPANGFHVPHSYALCRALTAFVNKQSADPRGAPAILITGDLTNRGSREEMDLVRSYLDGEAKFGTHIPLGLVPSQWRSFMIPGNHDHWDGAMWPFFPPVNTPKCGLLWPAATATVALPTADTGGSRKYIRFIGIDTDADTGRGQRAFALGSFCSQLEKLRRHPALKRPRPADEIRILCMHHALYYQRKPFLSILPESRRQLKIFLADHQISVILSGHIHETVFANFLAQNNGCVWRTLESSCGTTTRDVRTYRRRMEAFGIACLNQLVMHTVESVDGRLQWRAEDYHFREGSGFVSSNVPGNEHRAVSTIDLP